MNSVCLATYNGEKYIREQLNSILNQIASNDEVLIGDDGSTDNTLQIIESFNDDRIKLIINNKNLGHVKNFESLIKRAAGEIIFLSDQDDQWIPEKYQFIVDFLTKNTNVIFFHHSFLKINEEGKLLSSTATPIASWRKEHLLIAQLLRGYVFGCCFAFRASAKDLLLPFPGNVYAHDHWIALVAALNGGFHHDDIPLIYHRIHGNNLTPDKSLPFFKKFKFRFIQLQHCLEISKRKLLK